MLKIWIKISVTEQNNFQRVDTAHAILKNKRNKNGIL